MKKVLTKRDANKMPAGRLRPGRTATGTGTEGTVTVQMAWAEIEQRATVIGPVLEEILQARWNHRESAP